MNATVKSREEILNASFYHNEGFCFIMRGCAFAEDNLRYCGQQLEVESLYGANKHTPNDLVWYAKIDGEFVYFPIDTLIFIQ